MTKTELMQKIVDAHLTKEETEEFINFLSNMKKVGECLTCKRFIYCDMDKQAFYKRSGERCNEYEREDKQ